MDLNLNLKQTQILSFKQLQSMEILQLGAQELSERINKELLENPTLDVQEPEKEKTIYEGRQFTVIHNDYTKRNKTLNGEPAADRIYNIGRNDSVSLYDYLIDQLKSKNLTQSLFFAAEVIAGSLDENGYLRENISDIAEEMGMDCDILEGAADLIRSLDPPGVGAKNLADCLCLQLLRMEDADAAIEIVSSHLELVAQNNISAVSKMSGYNIEKVKTAMEMIRGLNPRPGDAFSLGQETPYIVPDVKLEVKDDVMTVAYVEKNAPNLRINSEYEAMLKISTEKEVQDYLRERLQRARWLISSVEQRKNTIIRCVETIADIQSDFFTKRADHLQPMTIYSVAEIMDVHPTTVSRAIRDKYIQFESGVYPLKFFFSRRLRGDISAHMAKTALRRIIAQEDKRKPLSDRKISEHLAEMDIPLSRRAVAKYREEMGIPSASFRKIIP